MLKVFAIVLLLSSTFMNSNYCAVGQSITYIDNVQDNNPTCFMTSSSHHRNITWQLIWEDQFKKKLNLDKKWRVLHNTKTCILERNGTQNCYKHENVRHESANGGYLALMVKQETYLKGNYTTGAAIYTKRTFAEGRYEIRAAAQPNLGEQIRACFDLNNKGAFNLTQYITVYCFRTNNINPTQGILFENSTLRKYYHSTVKARHGGLFV